MRKIKVFFNGERLRDLYPHATRFQVLKWKIRNFFRKVVIASFVIGVIYGAFKIGSIVSADTVYTAKEITKEVQVINAPVMDRIAKCESNSNHYDPKTGQVRTEPNKNGTVDIGYYQINEFYWGAKASELGLDLTKEKDNKKMGEWIYANVGTEPWSASRPCWNR